MGIIRRMMYKGDLKKVGQKLEWYQDASVAEAAYSGRKDLLLDRFIETHDKTVRQYNAVWEDSIFKSAGLWDSQFAERYGKRRYLGFSVGQVNQSRASDSWKTLLWAADEANPIIREDALRMIHPILQHMSQSEFHWRFHEVAEEYRDRVTMDDLWQAKERAEPCCVVSVDEVKSLYQRIISERKAAGDTRVHSVDTQRMKKFLQDPDNPYVRDDDGYCTEVIW